MSQQIPAEWIPLADEIQDIIDSVATTGFWTIAIINPDYEDLYIQGTWDEDDSEMIWLELGSDDSTIRTKLLPLGWSEPNDDIPNYWAEKPWVSDEEQRDAVAFLIEALVTIGLEADECELSANTEKER
jgi:hypothetical protein